MGRRPEPGSVPWCSSPNHFSTPEDPAADLDPAQPGDFEAGDAGDSQVWQPSQNFASMLCTEKKKVKKESRRKRRRSPGWTNPVSPFVLVPMCVGGENGTEQKKRVPCPSCEGPTLTCTPWSCRPAVPAAAAFWRVSRRAAAWRPRWATGPRSRSPPSCLPHPPSWCGSGSRGGWTPKCFSGAAVRWTQGVWQPRNSCVSIANPGHLVIAIKCNGKTFFFPHIYTSVDVN